MAPFHLINLNFNPKTGGSERPSLIKAALKWPIKHIYLKVDDSGHSDIQTFKHSRLYKNLRYFNSSLQFVFHFISLPKDEWGDFHCRHVYTFCWDFKLLSSNACQLVWFSPTHTLEWRKLNHSDFGPLLRFPCARDKKDTPWFDLTGLTKTKKSFLLEVNASGIFNARRFT